MARPTYERVYIWEWPVRLYHWITVASILVLAPTGFLIGRPPAVLTTSEAWNSFWFGYVRLAHFAAAYVFLFAFVLRVYWLFMGNRHARWSAFVVFRPSAIKKRLQGMWNVVRVDVLQLQKEPVDYVGHNPLAAFSYLVIFLLTAFMVATGFALYAPMSTWWLPQMFAWVTPLMGGDAEVRQWHHLGMWGFLLFAGIHVYLAVFHDVVEAKGEISSIVTGSRFVERQ